MPKGGQAKKQKGMGRFTRARTYVCIQFKGAGGMIHDILKLLIFPIWVGTYCCPLLAACKNRSVAMVRKTIWTISTHTAVVVLLCELQKRMAGHHVHGWAATCIHATCSCCGRISLQQRDRCDGWRTSGSTKQLDSPQRVSATREWRCLLLLLCVVVSGFCVERSRTATTA